MVSSLSINKRESSFELIRIIAQILIVAYHILGYIVYPMSGVNLFKAIWYPLHIGVPLFVLLSGYFGIKPSVKGFVKLISTVFILQIPYFVQESLASEDLWGGENLYLVLCHSSYLELGFGLFGHTSFYIYCHQLLIII